MAAWARQLAGAHGGGAVPTPAAWGAWRRWWRGWAVLLGGRQAHRRRRWRRGGVCDTAADGVPPPAAACLQREAAVCRGAEPGTSARLHGRGCGLATVAQLVGGGGDATGRVMASAAAATTLLGLCVCTDEYTQKASRRLFTTWTHRCAPPTTRRACGGGLMTNGSARVAVEVGVGAGRRASAGRQKRKPNAPRARSADARVRETINIAGDLRRAREGVVVVGPWMYTLPMHREATGVVIPGRP